MTIEAPGRDVIAIQMLRGIAATMVVFVHLDVHLGRLNYPTLGASWLASGVDIFFVISGFIMWTSVERRPELSASAFLRNRVVRIVPLYWLVTAVFLGTAAVAPHLFRTTVLEPGHVVSSFIFAPARHPITGHFWPLVIPGWSLNYEMLFYLLFAGAIALSGGNSKSRFLYIFGLITAVVAVGTATKAEVDLMNFYANPILFEFLIGIMLGILWNSKNVPVSWLWLPAVAAGFVVLWTGMHSLPSALSLALGAGLVVAGAVFLPQLSSNPLSHLGDASYSLYLTHPMSLAALSILASKFDVRPTLPVYIFSSVAFTIFIAFAVYACLERPMTKVLKHKSKPVASSHLREGAS